MCLKSGFRPSLSISVLRGVKYLPTVSTRPDESLSSYTLCMRPLPYVLHSKHIAQYMSCTSQPSSMYYLQCLTQPLYRQHDNLV